MMFNPHNNHHLLVIDDHQSIHQDFRKILANSSVRDVLGELESGLFGQKAGDSDSGTPIFEIDSAYDGEEGLALIERSLLEDRPYALAFVDVRMAPGWDGIETTCSIWKTYSELQVVLCTAYSDYSYEEILGKMGYSDKMVILRKPFDNIEVLQLAVGMTEKWRHRQQAKRRLSDLSVLIENLLRR